MRNYVMLILFAVALTNTAAHASEYIKEQPNIANLPVGSCTVRSYNPQAQYSGGVFYGPLQKFVPKNADYTMLALNIGVKRFPHLKVEYVEKADLVYSIVLNVTGGNTVEEIAEAIEEGVNFIKLHSLTKESN